MKSSLNLWLAFGRVCVCGDNTGIAPILLAPLNGLLAVVVVMILAL